MKQGNKSLGIVVTGGSKGLGYALAREFLEHGDRVVICARDRDGVEQAVASLRADVRSAEVYGIAFDVRTKDDLAHFKSFVFSRLGQVDRWINNAGTAGRRKAPLWEIDPDDMMETTATNLFGSMLLSKTAVEIMSRQPCEELPRYHIFNMGFSDFGARFSRSNIPHKASKLGVAALSRFLEKELSENGQKSIGVHELSPGLVKTGLLMRDTREETAAFLDLAADDPKKVAAVLAQKIRAAHGTASRIRYRSVPSMVAHMLARLVWRKASKIKERLLPSLMELMKGKGRSTGKP
ncbi:short-chain dehydrogenase [Prosthecochloris sp. GSB1]|uniref:SDR family NAD(P)-dependent oxidoreductase n=1 Tax=Prosthecochloris sp. GSB1 TaxID=281093 RepID=UPI000B8C9BFC|nr:SDR family oxidoreductase [Prosthecochloris sp. GSB1]ASQ91666.1 short-chain dehydrogenase [Prosthecochloris sp. GSB1]